MKYTHKHWTLPRYEDLKNGEKLTKFSWLKHCDVHFRNARNLIFKD